MPHPIIRAALLTPVCAVALAAVPGTPAAAEPPLRTTGAGCSFNFVTELFGDPEEMAYSGEIHGGPVTVVDTADPAAHPLHVTLTCSVQVGELPDHTGPDRISVSGSGTGVASFPPTFVSFTTSFAESVYFCQQLTVTDAHGDTRQYYLDTSVDFWEGRSAYSTDPTVPCRPNYNCQAISPRCSGMVRLLNYVLGVVEEVSCDAALVLAPGVPGIVDVRPDGDVYVAGEFIWDCPPYDW